ncbi:hypothetical protein BOX15_Mlig021210g2 [Macrostomum lignano]|uniref:Transmembrane protein 45B n=2 Tax=Macrostomum lignano TaxID=282301 RepID=A0A1I8IMC0_9PLAT|nr:hypothetical protein BOX15_Mlig021210g2 [Macrostomum lignano]
MGTFMGHFLPGSFFLGFSIWWTFAMLNRYYRAKYRKGPAYQSTATYSCICCRPGCCSSFQWEGILKVSCCTVGLIGEIVTGIDHQTGSFVHIGNGQHATMFSVFGFSGIIDLLMHCKAPLPKYTDYVFSALCFAVEGVLFMFHLHGRTKVDIVVHTLLVYVVWACVLSLMLEMKFQNSIVASLSRCFFVGLQGTWFIQVGAMLYPPLPGLKQFEQGDMHANVMIATIIFGWHMFGVFFLQLCLALILGRYHGKGASLSASGGQHREVSMERLIKSSSNNGNMSDLEESDTEFDASGVLTGDSPGNNGRLLLNTSEP